VTGDVVRAFLKVKDRVTELQRDWVSCVGR
jgi:hypothetical protein